jgi:4-alpha-glucanotransferase
VSSVERLGRAATDQRQLCGAFSKRLFGLFPIHLRFAICDLLFIIALRAMILPLFTWLKTRGAGVLLHPTSLPGDTGIGTFGKDALRFIDFLVEAGFTYWQVCPLGPTGYGDSPYQTFSAFAGNPYLIDLEQLVEQGWLESSELDQLRSLPADAVNYGAQWLTRPSLLARAYSRFVRQASVSEKARLRTFKRTHKWWLEPYARFIAIKARFHGHSWQTWPEELRYYLPAKQALPNSKLEPEIGAQVFYQHLFFEQWKKVRSYANSRGVSIIGDIPIFVAMDSSDVWSQPELFLMDGNLRPRGVAGVPPDYFSAEGQLWGNPLYDWKKHKKKGYSWWLARLRASFQLYDVVRIDHFRGFDEYCQIPPDAVNARVYEWKPGPGLPFFEIIRDAFPDAKLIAEDLGLITDSVRKLVKDVGAPGMKVLQFGFEGATEYLPHSLEPDSVLYPGTHDNDTAWGWFSKQPEEVKSYLRRYLRVKGDAVPWDLVRAGYASPSRLFVVPMQDLLNLSSEARLNTPGQATGNWRWRFTRQQVDQLWSQSAPYLRELAELYER